MTADLDTARDHASELDQIGPVDFIVLAFPADRLTGEAFPLLIDLVDRGIIRILDLAFLRKDSDGTVTTLSHVDLARMDVLEAALFEGAASGLLGPGEIEEAAEALDPGTAAAVLVYENVWATPFTAALRRSGGQLVASGHIPVPALVAALDALEAEDSATGSAAVPAPSTPAE